MPPRRPIATFLRPSPEAPADPTEPSSLSHDEAEALPTSPVDDGIAPLAVEQVIDAQPVHAPQRTVPAFELDLPPPSERTPIADAGSAATSPADTAAPSIAPLEDADGLTEAARGSATAALPPAEAITTPSFLRLPGARLRTPRWQWGMVAGLAAVLLVQIAVADRARLAADAGTRPWIAGLCSVLRCSLPAWREPAAFSMLSRDVRPVPGQAGALQVQASIRNDARWAQAWPSLRLSLSDADGRMIGTNVFAPADYLDRTTGPAATLEPGQSAQIAFRVREPAASTVAFTFEFL